MAFLAGCSGHYYQLPTPAYDQSKYEVVGSGTQTATGVMLFGFIPISLNSKIERATQRLISDQGGDAITNVSVRERWFWAYILNGYKVDVEGTVLRSKPQPLVPVESPKRR